MTDKQKLIQPLGRLLKEPMALFLLVAAAIFAFDALQSGEPGAQGGLQEASPSVVSTTIQIDQRTLLSLQEEFAWLEGRQPTAAETQALLQEWIDEEMLFRHALRQDMHLADAKMRAHLIEKVKLLWIGTPDEPEEGELLDFYMGNIKDYYREPRVSFDQVFFEQMPENPAGILARLNAGEQITGDGYWLGDRMADYGRSIIKTSFGGHFYQALVEAEAGEWVGPLASPRGQHFVQVWDRQEPSPLAYRDIRDRVEQDWKNAQLQARLDARTAELSKDFEVEMELVDE